MAIVMVIVHSESHSDNDLEDYVWAQLQTLIEDPKVRDISCKSVGFVGKSITLPHVVRAVENSGGMSRVLQSNPET